MKKLLFILLFWGVHAASSQKKTPSNARFGAIQWTFRTAGKIFSSPVLYRDLVVIGSEDKSLYGVHAASGKMAWKFASGGAVHSSAVISEDIVFLGSYDGNFYAVDAGSGRLKWKFRTKGEKKAGAMALWTMKPVTEYMDDPFDFFLSSGSVNPQDGVVYFGSGDGNVYALDVKDGGLKWKFVTGGLVHASPVLDHGTLYFGRRTNFDYVADSQILPKHG